MSSDLLKMLRKVSIVNVLVGAILTISANLLVPIFGLPVLLGAIVGIVNFILNTIITDYLFAKFSNGYKVLFMLSFIIRVAVICIIGFVLFTYNRFNVVAYVLGYTSHFVGLSIYGLNIGKEKGSD